MTALKTKLLMKRSVQRFLVPLGREPQPKKWVFIIGCYNSGTTLLSHIMGKHPEISALPVEGVALSDVWPRPEEFGWNRMWCRCLDAVRLMPGTGMDRIASRVRKQWSFSLKNRPLFLEKSIANAARLQFIQHYFSPAYFIYIVRNGYAVAEGIRRGARPRRWGRNEFGEQYPIAMCAEQWAKTDEIVTQDRHAVKHIVDISYEDFTENPKRVLNRLCDFLDIGPFPNRIVQQNWKIHGVTSTICNMNSGSIGRLSRSDIATVRQVAGHTLEKYGYLSD